MARVIGAADGILVGDQRRDQVLHLSDMNGDGDAADPSETVVFFDAANESGLDAPTGNVFAVHQAGDGSVLVGDGAADAVFRLIDHNADGDAQDGGEAAVWFGSDNASGLPLVTPNGIAEGPDGAIYVTNAGVPSAPTDAIYRTVDLNGDGDAQDAGEATVWLDLQAVVPTSVPFDTHFDGAVAYVNDLTGSGVADVIHRIEDLDHNGTIDPTTEVTPYITNEMNFGAPVDISSAVAPDGSLYTLSWFPEDGDVTRLSRLTDLDGSGRIYAPAEVVKVWSEDALPEGIDGSGSLGFIGFSVAVDGDGEVALTANGAESNVVTLRDLNGDGTFNGEGETSLFGSGVFDRQLERARSVEFHDGAVTASPATVGAGNHFSVFLRDGILYATGENVVGQLGNGATGFDIEAPLPVALPEGFDEIITSVGGGLLHTTFLTEGGDVYAFGFNNRGPLGQGDEETRPEAVEIVALEDVDVAGIASGNAYSFAWDMSGQLYAWGNNSNGQLGLGDRDERLNPVVVDALADQTVATVSAGFQHTLVLTAAGDVWAFGSNVDGQIGDPGLAADRRVLSPVEVEGLPDDIVAVAATTKTSYAVTAGGDVWGWGESRTGQLLQGTDNGDGTFAVDEADVATPVLLDRLPGNVIDVAGGARWAVALTADGDVWAWGPNDQGPTGGLDGDPAAEGDASFYPVKLDALDGVTVVEIATGPNSVIAVTDTGAIYTFGSNSDGRLGFASDGSVYEPTLVEAYGTQEVAPYLVSATPGDGGRDVAADAVLTLTFTEAVSVGTGVVRLVDRATDAVTEIDVGSAYVVVDGETVTVTPPDFLAPDARYAIQIDAGAFLDADGTAYAGIADGDVTTFDFRISDQAGVATVVTGTDGRDRLVGTDGVDRIDGGGGRYDRIEGGLRADDFVFGPADGERGRTVITDYETGIDAIHLTGGVEVDSAVQTSGQVIVTLTGDGDRIYLRGDDLDIDAITFVTEPLDFA